MGKMPVTAASYGELRQVAAQLARECAPSPLWHELLQQIENAEPGLTAADLRVLVRSWWADEERGQGVFRDGRLIPLSVLHALTAGIYRDGRVKVALLYWGTRG